MQTSKDRRFRKFHHPESEVDHAHPEVTFEHVRRLLKAVEKLQF